MLWCQVTRWPESCSRSTAWEVLSQLSGTGGCWEHHRGPRGGERGGTEGVRAPSAALPPSGSVHVAAHAHLRTESSSDLTPHKPWGDPAASVAQPRAVYGPGSLSPDLRVSVCEAGRTPPQAELRRVRILVATARPRQAAWSAPRRGQAVLPASSGGVRGEAAALGVISPLCFYTPVPLTGIPAKL